MVGMGHHPQLVSRRVTGGRDRSIPGVVGIADTTQGTVRGRSGAERWWEDERKVMERARAEAIQPEPEDTYARVAARLFLKLGDGPWMYKLDPVVARYVGEYARVAT